MMAYPWHGTQLPGCVVRALNACVLEGLIAPDDVPPLADLERPAARRLLRLLYTMPLDTPSVTLAVRSLAQPDAVTRTILL